MVHNDSIGYVVGGGLKENLRVRLLVPAQEVQEGSFVTIDSGDWRFYGLVTDLQLGATDPRFADEQSETRLPPALAALLHGQTLYTNLEVLPALMLERGPDPGSPRYPLWRAEHPEDPAPISIKTVPAHHAPVRRADAGDVAEIFGDPQKEGNFIVGHTREQHLPVSLNMDKFIQRSSGIFGATGTGKSFLTRIILAGLIQYDRASVLIFDMHNEYGPDGKASDTGQKIHGLRSKFPGKVRMVSLGRGSLTDGFTPDFQLEIAEHDITPSDIEMLSRELNLRETTPATLNALVHEFRDDWFRAFASMRAGATIETEEGKTIPAPDSVEAWALRAGVNQSAAVALHGKLNRLYNKPYIVDKPAADTLGEIIRSLEAGKHVVLSFGRFDSDLDYLLVTNMFTRQIRERWEQKTNEARADKNKKDPRPLVIAVEEAHKLLNREMAAQTAFSTIAREMRKYFVTLLIIDQRPSQIYDEVMSQLGTRICGWLGDDLDIQAVLSGLAGKDTLRGMLARLQPKEEVLLLGWGVPMPIPVRSRRYNDQFWRELKGEGSENVQDQSKIMKELGF
jgi:hypothetical protein